MYTVFMTTRKCFYNLSIWATTLIGTVCPVAWVAQLRRFDCTRKLTWRGYVNANSAVGVGLKSFRKSKIPWVFSDFTEFIRFLVVSLLVPLTTQGRGSQESRFKGVSAEKKIFFPEWNRQCFPEPHYASTTNKSVSLNQALTKIL